MRVDMGIIYAHFDDTNIHPLSGIRDISPPRNYVAQR
jgi:hypothetical protein